MWCLLTLIFPLNILLMLWSHISTLQHHIHVWWGVCACCQWTGNHREQHSSMIAHCPWKKKKSIPQLDSKQLEAFFTNSIFFLYTFCYRWTRKTLFPKIHQLTSVIYSVHSRIYKSLKCSAVTWYSTNCKIRALLKQVGVYCISHQVKHIVVELCI